MSGIFGFLRMKEGAYRENRELLSRMGSILSHYEDFVVEIYADDRAGIGRVLPDRCHDELQPLKCAEKRYFMFTDGYFDASDDQIKNSATNGRETVKFDGGNWILNLFKQVKMELGQSIQGIFTVAVYDSKAHKVYLFQDRYAVLPLYFVITPTGFYFSSEIKALLLVPDVDMTIDEKALSDFLCLGHFIGDETFIQKIRLFSYGRSYCIDSHLNIEKHKYWDYPAQFNYAVSQITRDAIEESTEKIETAILKFFRRSSSKAAVTLSAGLDSRTICAFASEVNPDITCLHIGTEESKETQIAHEVCKRFGYQWRLIERCQIMEENHLKYLSYLSDGHLNCAQFWLTAILPCVKEFDFVLDGALLDVVYELTGDFPLFDAQYKQLIKVSRVTDYGDAFNFIIAPYWPLSINLAESLFDQSITSRIRMFRETAISHLEEFESDDIGALSAYFYFTGRGRRFVWPMPLLTRNMTHLFLPGFDYDYFDYGTRLPINMRIEANIYRMIMMKRFPKLIDLPWSSTGLPISKFRTPFSDLKGKLKRYNYYLSRITNNRFGSEKGAGNYRFRFQADFRKIFRAILLDKRTGSRNHISSKNIKKLIHYQDSGKTDFSVIQRIVSIEMFYRNFID